MTFNSEQLLGAKTRKDLIAIAEKNDIPVDKTLSKLKYEAELHMLQTELVNLQKWIAQKKMRVVVLFEGRDAAGKGGADRGRGIPGGIGPGHPGINCIHLNLYNFFLDVSEGLGKSINESPFHWFLRR